MTRFRFTTSAVVLLLVPGALRGGNDREDRMHALSVLATFAGEDLGGEATKCGLPMITSALDATGSASAGVRDALTRVMARPLMQTSKASGRFRVHYDTSGIDAAAFLDALGQRIGGTAHAFADSALSILSHVENVETDQMGYQKPQGDGVLGGGPEYDVYVMELGNLYGYTTPDRPVIEGDTATTFVTIDNDFRFVRPDSNKGLPALRVTLAHEYHHAVQIGRYGYWTQDIFFYEITSTWLEDVVYTEVDDYYNYLRASWGHFRNPEQEFFSGSDLIMYSRSIWAQYLSKRFDVNAMRRCWEFCSVVRPAVAIDRALAEYGSSVFSAFSEWTLWNYFTGPRSDPMKYYDEGANFPQVMEVPADFVPPVREIPGSLAPLASRFYVVPLGSDTLTVVVVNLDYPLALSGRTSSAYTLGLASSRIDDSWQPTQAGLFVKLTVASPSSWGLWSILRGDISGGSGSVVAEGTAFPNPFRIDGTGYVSIPVNSTAPVSGTVTVFTSAMDRVGSFPTTSRSEAGRQVFRWDGRTDGGDLAQTGVYVVVVSLKDRTITSKIAVVRAVR